MPKITSKPRCIAGKDYNVAIYYTSAAGFYVQSGLPEGIENYVTGLPGRLRQHATEEALESALNKVVKDYETAIKSNRLVLVIDCSVNGSTADLLGWAYKTHSHLPLYPKHGSGEGHGLSFKFCTLREIAVGEAKEYRTLNGEDEGGRIYGRGGVFSKPGPGSIMLDYTPEREAFLNRIAEGLRQIGAQFAQFLTANPAEVAARIEELMAAGATLLMPPAPPVAMPPHIYGMAPQRQSQPKFVIHNIGEEQERISQYGRPSVLSTWYHFREVGISISAPESYAKARAKSSTEAIDRIREAYPTLKELVHISEIQFTAYTDED